MPHLTGLSGPGSSRFPVSWFRAVFAPLCPRHPGRSALPCPTRRPISGSYRPPFTRHIRISRRYLLASTAPADAPVTRQAIDISVAHAEPQEVGREGGVMPQKSTEAVGRPSLTRPEGDENDVGTLSRVGSQWPRPGGGGERPEKSSETVGVTPRSKILIFEISA